jgi:hypothetical protein
VGGACELFSRFRYQFVDLLAFELQKLAGRASPTFTTMPAKFSNATERQPTRIASTPPPSPPRFSFLTLLHASSALNRAAAVALVFAPALASHAGMNWREPRPGGLMVFPAHTMADRVSWTNTLWDRACCFFVITEVREWRFDCRCRLHFIGCDNVAFQNQHPRTVAPFSSVHFYFLSLAALSATPAATRDLRIHVLLITDHLVTPPPPPCALFPFFDNTFALSLPTNTFALTQSIFATHFDPRVRRDVRARCSRRCILSNTVHLQPPSPALRALLCRYQALGQSHQAGRVHTGTRCTRPAYTLHCPRHCCLYSVRPCSLMRSARQHFVVQHCCAKAEPNATSSTLHMLTLLAQLLRSVSR